MLRIGQAVGGRLCARAAVAAAPHAHATASHSRHVGVGVGTRARALTASHATLFYGPVQQLVEAKLQEVSSRVATWCSDHRLHQTTPCPM